MNSNDRSKRPTINIDGDQKIHYRMYKSGKHWVIAGLITTLLVVLPLLQTTPVHADTEAAELLASESTETPEKSANVVLQSSGKGSDADRHNPTPNLHDDGTIGAKQTDESKGTPAPVVQDSGDESSAEKSDEGSTKPRTDTINSETTDGPVDETVPEHTAGAAEKTQPSSTDAPTETTEDAQEIVDAAGLTEQVEIQVPKAHAAAAETAVGKDTGALIIPDQAVQWPDAKPDAQVPEMNSFQNLATMGDLSWMSSLATGYYQVFDNGVPSWKKAANLKEINQHYADLTDSDGTIYQIMNTYQTNFNTPEIYGDDVMAARANAVAQVYYDFAFAPDGYVRSFENYVSGLTDAQVASLALDASKAAKDPDQQVSAMLQGSYDDSVYSKFIVDHIYSAGKGAKTPGKVKYKQETNGTGLPGYWDSKTLTGDAKQGVTDLVNNIFQLYIGMILPGAEQYALNHIVTAVNTVSDTQDLLNGTNQQSILDYVNRNAPTIARSLMTLDGSFSLTSMVTHVPALYVSPGPILGMLTKNENWGTYVGAITGDKGQKLVFHPETQKGDGKGNSDFALFNNIYVAYAEAIIRPLYGAAMISKYQTLQAVETNPDQVKVFMTAHQYDAPDAFLTAFDTEFNVDNTAAVTNAVMSQTFRQGVYDVYHYIYPFLEAGINDAKAKTPIVRADYQSEAEYLQAIWDRANRDAVIAGSPTINADGTFAPNSATTISKDDVNFAATAKDVANPNPHDDPNKISYQTMKYLAKFYISAASSDKENQLSYSMRPVNRVITYTDLNNNNQFDAASDRIVNTADTPLTVTDITQDENGNPLTARYGTTIDWAALEAQPGYQDWIQGEVPSKDIKIPENGGQVLVPFKVAYVAQPIDANARGTVNITATHATDPAATFDWRIIDQDNHVIAQSTSSEAFSTLNAGKIFSQQLASGESLILTLNNDYKVDLEQSVGTDIAVSKNPGLTESIYEIAYDDSSFDQTKPIVYIFAFPDVEVKSTIKYVDADSGNQVVGTPVTQTSESYVAHSYTVVVPTNYELASNQAFMNDAGSTALPISADNTISYTPSINGDTEITITLKHQHVHYDATETGIATTRTVTFDGPTGSLKPVNVVKTVKWASDSDEVTDTITYTPDAGGDGFAVPVVPGWKPVTNQVAALTAVTKMPTNSTESVKYTANHHLVTVPDDMADTDPMYDATHKTLTLGVQASLANGYPPYANLKDLIATNQNQKLISSRDYYVDNDTQKPTGEYGNWRSVSYLDAVPVKFLTYTTDPVKFTQADFQDTIDAFIANLDDKDGKDSKTFTYVRTGYTADDPGKTPATAADQLQKTITVNLINGQPGGDGKTATTLQTITMYRSVSLDGKTYGDWLTALDGTGSNQIKIAGLTAAQLKDQPHFLSVETLTSSDNPSYKYVGNKPQTISITSQNADAVTYTKTVSYQENVVEKPAPGDRGNTPESQALYYATHKAFSIAVGVTAPAGVDTTTLKPDNAQQVIAYVRTYTADATTGADTKTKYGDWTIASDGFKDVHAKELLGYAHDISGVTRADVQPKLDEFEQNSGTNPGSAVFTINYTQNVTTEQAPDDPGSTPEDQALYAATHKAYTVTVATKVPDGVDTTVFKPDNATQVINYVRSYTADAATHADMKTKYGDWTIAGDSFKNVAANKVTGYAYDVSGVTAADVQPKLDQFAASAEAKPDATTFTITYTTNVTTKDAPDNPGSTPDDQALYAATHKSYTVTVGVEVPDGVDAATFKPDNAVQTINYTRSYTADAATGADTKTKYGDWTIVGTGFKKVDAKKVTGYASDVSGVTAADVQPKLDQFTNSSDAAPDAATFTIAYTTNVTTKNAPDDPGDTPEEQALYDATHKAYTVTVKVTAPADADVTKLTPDNAQQTLQYVRSYTADKTTDADTKTKYGDWTLAGSGFIDVKAKALTGYAPDIKGVTAADVQDKLDQFKNSPEATPDSTTFTINYTENVKTKDAPPAPGDTPESKALYAATHKDFTVNVVVTAPADVDTTALTPANAQQVLKYVRTYQADADTDADTKKQYGAWTLAGDGFTAIDAKDLTGYKHDIAGVTVQEIQDRLVAFVGDSSTTAGRADYTIAYSANVQTKDAPTDPGSTPDSQALYAATHKSFTVAVDVAAPAGVDTNALAPDNAKQVINYVRSYTADAATHADTKTTYGDWTIAGDEFVPLEAKELTGYKHDSIEEINQTIQNELTAFAGNSATDAGRGSHTITYSANVQTNQAPDDAGDTPESKALYDATHKSLTVTVGVTAPDGVDTSGLTPDNAQQVINYVRSYTADAATGADTKTQYGTWTMAGSGFTDVVAKPLTDYTAIPDQLTAADVQNKLDDFAADASNQAGTLTLNFNYKQTTFEHQTTDGGTTTIKTDGEGKVTEVTRQWTDGDVSHVVIDLDTGLATLTETPHDDVTQPAVPVELGATGKAGRTTLTNLGKDQGIELTHEGADDVRSTDTITPDGKLDEATVIGRVNDDSPSTTPDDYFETHEETDPNGGKTTIKTNGHNQITEITKEWSDGDHSHVIVDLNTGNATLTETPNGQPALEPVTVALGQTAKSGRTTIDNLPENQGIELTHDGVGNSTTGEIIQPDGNIGYTKSSVPDDAPSVDPADYYDNTQGQTGSGTDTGSGSGTGIDTGDTTDGLPDTDAGDGGATGGTSNGSNPDNNGSQGPDSPDTQPIVDLPATAGTNPESTDSRGASGRGFSSGAITGGATRQAGAAGNPRNDKSKEQIKRTQLPQTGEQADVKVSLLGLLALGFSMLGMLFKKRRNDDN